MYDTPENLAIRNIMVEGILKRMREKFSEEEIRIFIRCKVNLEPIPVIAKELGAKAETTRCGGLLKTSGILYFMILKSGNFVRVISDRIR